MARGDHKVEEAFGRFLVATVDIQQRVRVPLELGKAVSWLNASPGAVVECAASPGSAGGIRLEPLGNWQARHERFETALQRRGNPTSLDAAENWVELARLLVTTWRVTINVEETRYSFTIPEPVRRTQLLPSAKGTVVVFGFGEIFEIWEAAAWFSRVRTLKGNPGAIADAFDDIEAL
ncbi:MAG TPA: hypothetical protein VE974_11600 [Thermoanaerobaculia bacterium]|nr:hypothetical protein [Thermoanaerobaculia bacterium]